MESRSESPWPQSTAQRAMLAADTVVREGWDVVAAAEFYDVGVSTVRRALVIKQRSADVAYLVRRGDLSIKEASRRVGFVEARRGNVTRGDRWGEVMEAARHYAEYWVGREYRHVNPKEARRRLASLHDLQRALESIERELQLRSHEATLNAPRR